MTTDRQRAGGRPGPARRRSGPVVHLLVAVVCLSARAGGAAPGRIDDPPDGPPPLHWVEVPLSDGRLELRELLTSMFEQVERPPPPSLATLAMPIAPGTAAGRAQLNTLRRRTRAVMAIDPEAPQAVVSFERERFLAAVGEPEAGRRWLEELAASLTTVTLGGRRLGVTAVEDRDPRMRWARVVTASSGAPERLVLLVHGLDDPGWMWRDVIPALREAGYTVARFEYPNDGPVREAADLLAVCLGGLAATGVEHVDVVAHSMGGLVTRDVLTRPAYYAGDGAGDAGRPSVDRFIMCGTPNHGSELARLRSLAEIKEQLTRVLSGGAIVSGILDGKGEAAVDLLPGSEFLRDLNDRPLAGHTGHTIIAGRMSPVTGRDLDDLHRQLRRAAASSNAPRWLRNWLDSADRGSTNLVNEVVRGLGDGCVTLDSARLPGVDDFVSVEANHVGMIVNLLPSAETTPPAIPIILRRLADDAGHSN